jgi:hypothetical protein
MTTNQRKHVTQMSRREITRVLEHIQGLTLSGFDNPHVRERKSKWDVSDADIRQAIRSGELIECHANNYPDIRFVMRNDSGLRSICVCSNVSGEIITVWVNTVNDNHSTLRLAEYQWKADLTNVFDALGGK